MKFLTAVISSLAICFFLCCSPGKQYAPGGMQGTIQIYPFVSATHETGTLYTVCLQDRDSVIVVRHYNRANYGTKWHRFYSYNNFKLQAR